ncbi:MAG: Rpp14/Pop5 family protein [Halodesulfurarchaeum sp.]
MRHLPKHLQPRYRYLAVEIETWADLRVSASSLQDAIRTAARTLLGDAGSAELDLRLIETEIGPGGGAAIVRVRRGAVDRARAALACVESIEDTPVRVGVRGVGGTIRAAEESYMGGPPEPTGSEDVEYGDRTGVARRRADRVDLTLEGTRVGATPQDL